MGGWSGGSRHPADHNVEVDILLKNMYFLQMCGGEGIKSRSFIGVDPRLVSAGHCFWQLTYHDTVTNYIHT